MGNTYQRVSSGLLDSRSSNPRHDRLYKWNVSAAILHLAVTIILAVFVFSASQRRRSMSVAYVLPEYNTTTRAETLVIGRELSVDIGGLVLSQSAITTLAHFLYVRFFDEYIYYYQQGATPYRWIEYSITASIVFSTLYLFVGGRDVDGFVCIIFLTAIMQYFGYASQIVSGKFEKVVALFVGGLILLAQVIMLFVRFHETVSLSSNDPPSFVLPLTIFLCIMYAAFGVNRMIPIVLSFDAPFYHEEIGYIILSFVAKTVFSVVLASRVFV